MVRSRCALTLIACAALVAGACNRGEKPKVAGDSEVVARVGDRPITRSYFEQRLEKMDRRFLPDTLDLAGKRKFLDFIVNKELMALRAEELQYDKDPRIVNALATYEDNLAANAAIDRLTKGQMEPTEADIQEFYTKKHNKILTQHLVVKTRHEAVELRKRAVGGEDFEKLADQYSTVPRTDVNTGEELPLAQRVVFGEVQYGEAMVPVEEAVFGTAIGAISEPVETGYGWHLFKPMSVSQVTLPPLDAEGQRRISVQIQMRRKRVVTEAYYEEIGKANGYELDEEAVAFVYDKLPPDVDPEQRPDPATEVKPVIAFTAEERNRQLFRLQGQWHTIGEFSDRYDATSWFERPKRITGALGVKYWIRDRWMKPLQLERARKDGIYELPEVANEIRLRREQMMVTMLHTNLVEGQAPEPTPAQLQEFYDTHKDVYVDGEKRRVNIIYNQQERVVRRAYDEIQGGKDFVEVAVRYNESATKPEDVQSPEFTRDTPEFAEIAPQAFALEKIGDRSEPFKTQDFWVLMQLAAVTPKRQFALDEIHENVVQDFKNQWNEDKLNELLVEWKKNVKIDVDEKTLERVQVTRTDVYVPGRPATPASDATTGGTN